MLEPVLEVQEVIADEVTFATAGYEPIIESEVTGGAEAKARIVAYTQPNPYMDEWLGLPEHARSTKDLIPVLREIEAPITIDFKMKRVADQLTFRFTRAEIGALWGRADAPDGKELDARCDREASRRRTPAEVVDCSSWVTRRTRVQLWNRCHGFGRRRWTTVKSD